MATFEIDVSFHNFVEDPQSWKLSPGGVKLPDLVPYIFLRLNPSVGLYASLPRHIGDVEPSCVS